MDSQQQPIHIIYLHGFKSNSAAIKAGQLRQFCQAYRHIHVHVPDLNAPPQQVWSMLCQLVQGLPNVCLVGSSLGGFYATQLVAKFSCPTVLINPAMRPWRLFKQVLKVTLPYAVTPTWSIDQAQLFDLQALADDSAQQSNKILLLLQQGDEVLDYREAQRYYKGALLMLESGGSHAMVNFEQKLPMLLQFLSDSIH